MKRYSIGIAMRGDEVYRNDTDGEYVRYEDYEELELRLNIIKDYAKSITNCLDLMEEKK